MKKTISSIMVLIILVLTLSVVCFADQSITGIAYSSDGQINFNAVQGADRYSIVIGKGTYETSPAFYSVADIDSIIISNSKVIFKSKLISDAVASYVSIYNSLANPDNKFDETGIVVFELNIAAYEGAKFLAATEAESNYLYYDFDNEMLTNKKPVYDISIVYNKTIEDRSASEFEKIYTIKSSNVSYAADTPLTILNEDEKTIADMVTPGNKYWFVMNVEANDGYFFSSDTKVYVNNTDVTTTSASYQIDEHTGKAVMTIRWYDTVVQSRFNLSFYGDGGSNVPNQVKSDKDGVAIIPENIPTKTKYEFLGWKIYGKQMVEYHPGDSVQITKDTTLYPVWNEIKVSIKSARKTINYGQILKVEATADERYTIHWLIDGDDTGKTGKVFEYDYSLGNHTLTANVEVLNGDNAESASADLKVTVNSGFFQRISAFFKYTLLKNSRYVNL